MCAFALRLIAHPGLWHSRVDGDLRLMEQSPDLAEDFDENGSAERRPDCSTERELLSR